MFGIGNTELLILGIIALLLFGNRLPSVMRSLGSGVSQFKKGLDDVNREIHREVAAEPPVAAEPHVAAESHVAAEPPKEVKEHNG